MKKTIAVLGGGDSSESVISVKSAAQVIQNIDHEKFLPFLVHVKGSDWNVEISKEVKIKVNKDDFSFEYYGKRIKFDCAFIIIHGTPGENGILQSYFDLLKVPYTTCSAFSSALTFNKYATKLFLKEHDIKLAKDFFMRKKDKIDIKEIVKAVGLPAIVKPNNGGSSFGITLVKELDQLEPAIKRAFEEDGEVLIEEFLKSRELTCGVFKGKKKEYILPITEIISQNEFFDYEAKYEGASREVTPAEIPAALQRTIKDLSSKIYDILDCKGVVRIDYLYNAKGLYFMEINTVPGQSEASIIPQQVRAAGYNLVDFYSELIEDAVGN
ncbi:MAG: D-alanine--D-alanine ligase A [Bacteroidetes bacterium GWF2_38_335]|nr:MAG: D-alanine--D-alanine ligase A [Bacteroidetes bacterium GWF2_38_335]OFY79000.1 MAG: D-alanine--D-alanine ligase A [Bacteroidetes bacterium RIFOXYA12_FULL_38_20]HBS86073.1 D-alanine--D-alanine ligase [Bacteroidales bacterium]